jgi:hypothetical protein
MGMGSKVLIFNYIPVPWSNNISLCPKTILISNFHLRSGSDHIFQQSYLPELRHRKVCHSTLLFFFFLEVEGFARELESYDFMDVPHFL